MFDVLSPDSPLEFKISGRPATFIDKTLNVPDAADAARAGDAIARRSVSAESMIDERGWGLPPASAAGKLYVQTIELR